MDILNPKGLAEAGQIIEHVQELWGQIQQAWQNKDLAQLGPLCQNASQILGQLKKVFPQQGEEIDKLSEGFQQLPKVMDSDNADEAMAQVQQMVTKLTQMGA